jgi:preprotein translocase subunit SecD
MRRFFLLFSLLSLPGCGLLFGPEHEATVRLDDPPWRETGHPADPDAINKSRKLLVARLREMGARLIKYEQVAGEARQVRFKYRGKYSKGQMYQLLGSAGRLEYRFVYGDKSFASPDKAPKELSAGLPENVEWVATLTSMENPNEEWYPLEKPVIMSDCDVQYAATVTDPDGRPSVEFAFTAKAGEQFKAVTRTHLKRRLAIVLNGKVLVSSIIESELDRRVTVHGSFTNDQARLIAGQLNRSCMPLQPVLLEFM